MVRSSCYLWLAITIPVRILGTRVHAFVPKNVYVTAAQKVHCLGGNLRANLARRSSSPPPPPDHGGGDGPIVDLFLTGVIKADAL